MGHGGAGGHIGVHPLWKIGPFVVNADTMIYTWMTMAIVILIGFLAARGAGKKLIPGGWQNAMEMVFEFLGNQMEEALGSKAKRFAPLLITLFLFILISNWLGLIPTLKSPTSDLNTTFGLALMVVAIVHISGILDKGLGYFKHFFEPYPVFVIINIFEEIAKPITLAFRLFGNILAGEVMIVVLAILWPMLPPVVSGASVLWLAFSVFVGVIQAFIFTMLSMTFIGHAVKDEHHD